MVVPSKQRYLFLAVCFASLMSAVMPSVALRLAGGVALERVTMLAQDDEYTLSVVCPGHADDLVIEGVHGNPAFAIQRIGTSQSMTFINGRAESTVTYNYRVRPLERGTFRLGPAAAVVNGQQERSEAVTVEVVEQAEYDQHTGKHHKRAGLVCQLAASTNTAVIGQPVTVTVTIEDDGRVHNRSLQPPSFGKLKFTPLGDPISQQKLINGQVRVHVQQQYTVTADEPGTYTVGPAIAHFVVPSEEEDGDPFGGFFGMRMGGLFGAGGTKRSVRSNSIEIAVAALPQTDQPVDGVGQFDSLVLHTDKRVVDLNEPFAVQLKLTGEGNFDAMLAPALQLPDYMTVYDSNASFRATGLQQGVKTFEYLVQIGQDGSHTLPAQEFSYFDTAAQQHRTLRSKPVSITVKAARPVPAAAAPAAPADTMGATEDEYEDDEPFFDEEGTQAALSWWLLALLMLIPLGFLLRNRLARMLFVATEMLGLTSQEKRDARMIAQLVASSDIAGLHREFVRILAQCWQCDASQIDEAFIEKRTQQWEWDAKKRDHFAAFIASTGQAAFAPQLMSDAERKALLAKASYWHTLIVQGSKRS